MYFIITELLKIVENTRKDKSNNKHYNADLDALMEALKRVRSYC